MSTTMDRDVAVAYAAKGKTPLMAAVAYQRLSYIQFLVEHGADCGALDNQGMSLLHIAAWFGHQDVLDFLLKNEAALKHLEVKDSDGRTPLLVASFRASTACCELLHAAGANVDVVDGRNNRPAALAGRVGRRKSKELCKCRSPP